jgi:hypothetical protein
MYFGFRPAGCGRGVIMKKLSIFLILVSVVAWGCKAAAVSGSAGDKKMPSADPKGAVLDFAHKFNGLKSLSGQVEATGDTPFSKHVDYVAPDRYHVVYHDQAGADMDMIIAGEQSYVKSGDSWNKLHADEAPTPTMRYQFSDETMKTLSDPKFEGEETVNGKPALVYTYKRIAVVGNFHVTCKVWVDKDSGLPIKSYEEYAEGVVKTRTTTFDTQTPVTIDLPVGK